VSVPKKPAVAAGLRVSEEDVKRIGLYTMLCMPLATALFGVAVFLRRRGGERRGRKAVEKAEGSPARAASEGSTAREAAKGPAKGKKKKKKTAGEDGA
jgi:hypothetical protein